MLLMLLLQFVSIIAIIAIIKIITINATNAINAINAINAVNANLPLARNNCHCMLIHMATIIVREHYRSRKEHVPAIFRWIDPLLKCKKLIVCSLDHCTGFTHSCGETMTFVRTFRAVLPFAMIASETDKGHGIFRLVSDNSRGHLYLNYKSE